MLFEDGENVAKRRMILENGGNLLEDFTCYLRKYGVSIV